MSVVNLEGMFKVLLSPSTPVFSGPLLRVMR